MALSLHLGKNFTLLSEGHNCVSVEFSEVTGSVCTLEEVWFNQLLYSGGCSGGRKRQVLDVSRPSGPPAGRSEQCIWPMSRKRRRGMLLFSSALWRSGAKIADSSSIHTGSRSTHSPVRHKEAWTQVGGSNIMWTFAFSAKKTFLLIDKAAVYCFIYPRHSIMSI